ncbi:hypothetical protein P23_1241 [Acinetobacter calcoaceticus]|nr:hypothetical protein P23_1241 [Acinetobacter calcoaceticus]
MGCIQQSYIQSNQLKRPYLCLYDERLYKALLMV